MKEIPILFSTSMVQAILAGRKTQTRRIIKPQPTKQWAVDTWCKEGPGSVEAADLTSADREIENLIESSKWKPGDILWVRETWQYWNAQYQYRAEQDSLSEIWKCPLKFKPSIHMPKEAARIWLQVEDIRVERLQDISEEDAMAEGVRPAHCEDHTTCPSRLCNNGCTEVGTYWDYLKENCEGEPCYSAKESFQSLWQKINGPESWDVNPWVFVVTFKLLSTTGKNENI